MVYEFGVWMDESWFWLWFMFGMMNEVRYGGLNVDVMEVWRMKKVVFFWMREKKKKIFFFGWWVGTAVPTFWKMKVFFFFFWRNIFFFWMWWVWFLVNGFKKISPFASYLDKYLQNKLKQHKTNKIKAIKHVGCLPRSARLKSLAWRLEGGFSTLYPIFHKETRASNLLV